MKKLFELKKWLSLPDAAQHLSILFGEDVKEADVLRLALDKHLKLSVRFVNGTYAKRGERVSLEKLKQEAPFLFKHGDAHFQELLAPMEDYEFWEFPNSPRKICGIWDLPMIGDEKYDIEIAYQRQTDGPEVTPPHREYTIVTDQDGIRFRLQERFDENEFQRDSVADLKKLEERISHENMSAPEAKKLLVSHYSQNYYPAGGLPSDSVLVVRTSALQELEARFSEPNKRIEKPLQKRERDTLLTIIGALAELAKIDISKPSKAAMQIESQTIDMEARVAARTIEDHLKRVPEAVEDRSQS